MKKIIVLTLALLAANLVEAQDLKFTINELADTNVYLAKYFGKKLYYADTAKSVNGVVHFDGAKHPTGVYAIVIPGPKYFEVIVNNEKIDMKVGDQNDFIGSMDIVKSKNNTIFYDYINYMTVNKKASKKLVDKLGETEKESDKDKIKDELSKLNEDVVAYQKQIAKDHKDLFVGQMIGMSLDIELPESPKNEDGSLKDSSFLYNYNVAHFWDNVDLKNEDIIRTPIFHNKLEKYYSNQIMLQIPDSIIKYTTDLVSKTNEGTTVFQYIVHFVTNKYEKSEIMGMDAIFVHMADTYYCPKENTKAFWMSDENLTKVCERADKIRPLIIGAYAPRLILTDTTEKNWIDFYKLKAEYKILYFWDPNCGHCKKVTPKLEDLYQAKFKERGIEIYAVGKATGDDFEAWKTYIADNKLSFINVGLTKSVYIKHKKMLELISLTLQQSKV
jgi:thiol-disulfide isomerase/thioredoxin